MAHISTFLALACLSCASAAANDTFTVMREWGGLGTFCRLIERAQLVDVFRTQNPLTVFAPTDRAFERMDQGALRAL